MEASVSNDLYHHNILTWSRTQAERLRRVAAGERVNDIDWAHVIQEIEDMGKSEVRAVASLLRQAIVHALKLVAMPHHQNQEHWHEEAIELLSRARELYEPGMAQAIDLRRVFERARKQVLTSYPSLLPMSLSETIDLSIAELMDEEADLQTLIERLGCD